MVYRLYVEKKPATTMRRARCGGSARFPRRSGTEAPARAQTATTWKGSTRRCSGARSGACSPSRSSTTSSRRCRGGLVLAADTFPGSSTSCADSAALCVQLMAQCDRPAVRTATVYLMDGALCEADVEKIRRHVINPVERRKRRYDTGGFAGNAPSRAGKVQTLVGFREMNAQDTVGLIREYGLAMDAADVAFCRDYFRSIDRDPTLTELRLLDTYWSDHCRHTDLPDRADGRLLRGRGTSPRRLSGIARCARSSGGRSP